MTRRTAPTAALSIPKELWYPTTTEPNLAPAPHLSLLTRLLPLIAIVAGYSAALASTAHRDALAPALLLLAFLALARFGYALLRYAIASARHRRSEAGR